MFLDHRRQDIHFILSIGHQSIKKTLRPATICKHYTFQFVENKLKFFLLVVHSVNMFHQYVVLVPVYEFTAESKLPALYYQTKPLYSIEF